MAYAHDDLSSIIHITLRTPMSEYFKTSYALMYYAFTGYKIGAGAGIIVGNILAYMYSYKRLMLIACGSIWLSSMMSIIYKNFYLFTIMRFIEGMSLSVISIVLIVLLKRTLSSTQFDTFLNQHFILVCTIEAVCPILFSYICSSASDIKYVFYIFMTLASAYLLNQSPYTIQDKPKDTIDNIQSNADQPCIYSSRSFTKAVELYFTSYKNIIQSRSIWLLLSMGIAIGSVDFFTISVESMIQNVQSLPYVLGASAIGGMLIIHLISSFIDNYYSCHDKSILVMIYLSIVLILLSSVTLLTKNSYYIALLYSLFIGCSYSIEYICSRNLYFYIKDTAAIGSIILLTTSIGPVLSYIFGAILSHIENMILFNTVLLLLTITSAIVFNKKEQDNRDLISK